MGMMPLKFTIISLFPEALQPYLDSSMLYKAQARGIISIDYANLRDFGLGPHKSVDDTPYGGGDGMLLRCEPVFAAVESVKAASPEAKVILPTPVGQVWTQTLARQFAGVTGTDPSPAGGDCERLKRLGLADEGQSFSGTSATNGERTERPEPRNDGCAGACPEKTDTHSPRHYIILCPHYEGYDERIMTLVDYPISLGDYVLTGGELPALILIDSITRLLPGVLGGATSAEIESFSDGDRLEYPQYTKPAEFRGLKVPDVLLSGHHGKVAEWRAQESARRTAERHKML